MIKRSWLLGLPLFLLFGCSAVIAPSSHNLVEPGTLHQGERAATIEVPTNVSVIIIEIDGKLGPNPHQIGSFPSVYNNTFTQAASVQVAPGPHKIRVACTYQPGTFSKAEYRVREIGLNLQSGEVVSLFPPEQEKAVSAGLVLPRTASCPIRVKSSRGREVVLPDPGN